MTLLVDDLNECKARRGPAVVADAPLNKGLELALKLDVGLQVMRNISLPIGRPEVVAKRPLDDDGGE